MSVEIARQVRLSDSDSTVEVARRSDGGDGGTSTHQVAIRQGLGGDPEALVWASLADLRAFANAILDTFPEDEEGES